jgi:hypothetical protein
MSGADGDDVVKPVVFFRCRLEHRVDPEIVAVRINLFATLQPRNDVGWALAYALVCHADQRTVPGSKVQPDIQQRTAVMADGLPVAAAIQNLAGETFAFECATENNADTPRGQRRLADDDDRSHGKLHGQ